MRRSLEGDSNDEGTNAYLQDENGNEYDPYSTAWRYLGVYTDCDISTEDDQRRRLDDGSSACPRVLLWAFFFDPNYTGQSIGGYQMFDISTHHWDTSTCQTQPCRKLDCHSPNTNMQLLGVFKEELNEFTTLLISHECLWNSTQHEFMSDMVESNLPEMCTQIDRFVDRNGNVLYQDLQPQYSGDVSIGIYVDNTCTTESSDISFFDYIMAYEKTFNYVSEESAYERAFWWYKDLEQFNAYMETYSACQPCPAYSRAIANNNDEERFMESNDESDGQEEPWGYNCYDENGDTSCNQCSEFLTQLNMQEASQEDLERATSLGTIYQIKYNGETFGTGIAGAPAWRKKLRDFGADLGDIWQGDFATLAAGIGLVLGVMLFLIHLQLEPRRKRNRALSSAYRERLVAGDKLELDPKFDPENETTTTQTATIPITEKDEQASKNIGRKKKKRAVTFESDEGIKGGGCQTTQDRLADLWVLFSPNTDLEEALSEDDSFF